MKGIIAGSRTIISYPVVCLAVANSGFNLTEVVSGGAPGVDTLGEQWAMLRGINLTVIPAEWDRLGKQAGYVRNMKMAEYADALIAIWDGKSRGTSHMINIANKKGLRVYIHLCKGTL